MNPPAPTARRHYSLGQRTSNGSTTLFQGEYFFRVHPLNNSAAPVFDTLTITPSGGTGVNHDAYLPQANEDFTYDDDGNLLSDGRWNYTYDAENRVESMETIAAAVTAGVTRQSITFGYDYLGRRAVKYIEGGWNGSAYTTVTTWERYLYDGWNLIAAGDVDTGTNGTVIDRKYYWGLDLSGSKQGAGGVGGLLMTQEGGNTYLPAYDALGNVHAMIKASDGSLAAAYEYDAYGNTLRETGPYAAANPFRFATKYTDAETGLVYHDTRYYSPSLGRFINRDSIGEQGGLNLYAYVSNHVPNAFDYLGMNSKEADGGGEFGFAAGAGGPPSRVDWSGTSIDAANQRVFDNTLFGTVITTYSNGAQRIIEIHGRDLNRPTSDLQNMGTYVPPADVSSRTPQSSSNAPNSAGTSTTTAGTQTVTYTIVTVIRPDDAQAGEKSRQTVTINPATGELVSNTYTTGHTVVPFFGNKLPSRSDSFIATSSSTPAGHRVTVTGETGSWLMPVNINYSFQIYYNTTTGSVSIRGAHDGYPSYEVWRGDVQVYDHQQQNLRQLGGSGDVNVKRDWKP